MGGSLTDRHLVVESDNLLDAIDIIVPLMMKPFSFNWNIHHNTERYVKHVWAEKKLSVKQIERSMFLVARKSEKSWKLSTYYEVEGAPGLFLKYNTEWRDARHGYAAQGTYRCAAQQGTTINYAADCKP